MASDACSLFHRSLHSFKTKGGIGKARFKHNAPPGSLIGGITFPLIPPVYAEIAEVRLG